ncbi:hypothetical protein NKR23_g7739 [Pleurostoma richardsiae]|uniref:SnoaL-like domain-containing protein n=1 Tax=Pleurostoma richardsiae TaxID=41990 RepID=A0AA38VMG7_9PEZI|nr:hypothetical protein NKR23_g7739 [Pleurostoma richardsiae]
MAPVSTYSDVNLWAAAVSKAFSCPDEELESHLLSHLYTKDSIITVNGQEMTWDAFLAYLKIVRGAVSSVDVSPHHLLRDGRRFAIRHTSRGHRHEGPESHIEAMVMGEVDDEGRALWVEEVANFVEGTHPAQGDQDINDD